METLRANAVAGHTRMGVCISRQGAWLGLLPEYRCIYDYGMGRISPMVTKWKAVHGITETAWAGLAG